MAIRGVGLLLIRAWVEDGSELPLRVEVKFTSDTRVGFEHEATFVDREAVEAAVHAWLMTVDAPG